MTEAAAPPAPVAGVARRTLSLRNTLTLLALGLAVYVAAVVVFLAVRIAPRAAAVQAQDQHVLGAYDEMHSRADVLSQAVRGLYPLLLPIVRDSLNATSAPQRGEGIRHVLDSLDATGTVLIAGGSIELRVALASTVDVEARLAAAIRRTVAAIRVNQLTGALAHLEAASNLERETRAALSAAERVALRDLVARERELSAAALSGVRVISWWIVTGVLLLLWVLRIVQRRLYHPLAALDAAMHGVASGDLSMTVPVRRHDELGRVTHQFNQMIDLLRQRAEEQRRRARHVERERAEAERARIFNLSVDLLAVAGMDATIHQVNPAVERILGFKPEEVTGRSFLDYIHPDDIPATLSELNVLLSGRPVHAFRIRFLRTDGAYRWIAWSANPPEGGVFYVMGRDVTDEKVAEEHQLRLQMELERSAREWRLTFDAIDHAILILDRFGAVTRLNAAARKLAGRSYDDVLGRTLGTLGAEPPWPGAADVVAETTGGSPVWRQIRHAATGRTWDVEATAVPGVEQRTILNIRDVTPLARLQESLRRSETMSAMGQLVAGVAHEVRNPLFSMTATLDAFEAKSGVRPEDARHLAVMRSQLTRLTHLMEDLLEYGKPPSLQLAPQALDAILVQAAEACAVLADKHGVQIVRNVAADLPRVQADRLRLVQVFANLLANGIQHSREGGAVTVHAVRLGDGPGGEVVECRVVDAGAGFAPDDLPHIFEPFFTKRRGGTGLGLALVQRIIEQHGGTVAAANRPDGGAELLIRIRAASDGTGGAS